MWIVTDDFGNTIRIARNNEWSILESITASLDEYCRLKEYA